MLVGWTHIVVGQGRLLNVSLHSAHTNGPHQRGRPAHWHPRAYIRKRYAPLYVHRFTLPRDERDSESTYGGQPEFWVLGAWKLDAVWLTDLEGRAGLARLYWAVDVLSVPVAARGMMEVLSSCEDCPTPCGCGLSLAAESRVPEISLWSWTASATLGGRVLLNNSERL